MQAMFIEWSGRKNSLTDFLAGLGRFLRSEGFRIGPNEMSELFEGIMILGAFRSYEDLRSVSRSILAKTPEQYFSFFGLFDQFWNETHRAQDSKLKQDTTEGPQQTGEKEKAAFHALKDWLHGNRQEEEHQVAVYSREASLARKAFAEISDEEVREMLHILRMIGRQLARQLSRRLISSRKGGMDIRKLVRKNMKNRSEFIDLFFRDRKKNRQRIVLICDISKSMELYTRFLVHFAYSFQMAFKNVETFMFSTSLHHVTPALRSTNASFVTRALSKQIDEWNGGTQIGSSLAAFCSRYLRKHVQSNTIVLILSDGWDTGDPRQIRESMQSIHARARKVIWMNPFMGHRDFQPATRALKAALPYVDSMIPSHDAESLKQLSRVI